MIKKYSEFLFENLNRSKSILKSKLDDYEKLKKLLTDENAMGYMGKFTELLFNGVPYNELITLYNDIKDFKKKNIKINIDSYDKYESILDDFDKKKISYKFKAIYNKFPKEQKDLFNLDDMDDEDVLTISKLYDVDITPFIKKISTYKKQYELVKGAKRYLQGKSQSFDRESVKNMMDDDLQLVFENDNIIIVKTKTWEAIKKIGPDTSWCIVRSQSTFNSYTKDKNRNQFVAIDYTKDTFEIDFKIGFTVGVNNDITNAHNILDYDAITEIKELLKMNNVQISDINILPKLDFSTFNRSSKLKEIENALDSSIIEEDSISKLLSILSWKLSRSRSGHEIEKLIKKVFKKILKKKGVEILTIEDVDKFKDCFTTENQFNSIKDSLSNSFILLTKEPPNGIFNDDNIDKVLKYYKNWNYKLENDLDYYLHIVRQNKEYADIILYYALKIARKNANMMLIIEYCKMIKGEKINLQNVKNIIDNSKSQLSKNKYAYYNYFGIKYHFSEDDCYLMELKNVIDEDVIIKKPQYNLITKLSSLANCNVTLNFDINSFLSKANDHYKLMNGQITGKANSKDEVIGQIINVIKDKLTFKSRKMVFKDDVKFPITFKTILSSNDRYNKLPPKEVTIIMR